VSLKQEESELFRGYVTRALPRARILKDTDVSSRAGDHEPAAFTFALSRGYSCV